VSTLDDNEIFGTVLSYVGYGDYFYVAGVCRKWRGCYISFCHSNAPVADNKHVYKLRTLRRAIITTAARLQLALNNGAKLTVLDVAGTRFSDSSLAKTIASESLQPIEVLSLLRVYGYHWDTNLHTAAVLKGNLELIMWLHQVHCPAPLAGHIAHKCCTCTRFGAVSILQWLHLLQPEWFSQKLDNTIVNKTWLLGLAGQHCNLAVMQWLRCEVIAEWPNVQDIICNEDDCTVVPTWSVKAVIWALDNGLEFEFDCSKLIPEKHVHEFDKEEANVLWLWQWLHKERNRHRCTCSSA
jgi:hypothetical protein